MLRYVTVSLVRMQLTNSKLLTPALGQFDDFSWDTLDDATGCPKKTFFYFGGLCITL